MTQEKQYKHPDGRVATFCGTLCVGDKEIPTYNFQGGEVWEMHSVESLISKGFVELPTTDTGNENDEQYNWISEAQHDYIMNGITYKQSILNRIPKPVEPVLIPLNVKTIADEIMELEYLHKLTEDRIETILSKYGVPTQEEDEGITLEEAEEQIKQCTGIDKQELSSEKVDSKYKFLDIRGYYHPILNAFAQPHSDNDNTTYWVKNKDLHYVIGNGSFNKKQLESMGFIKRNGRTFEECMKIHTNPPVTSTIEELAHKISVMLYNTGIKLDNTREVKLRELLSSLSPIGKKQEDITKVTRFEVVDDTGRVYSKYNTNVELSYQDDGRTLKAFINIHRAE